jgi:hypothetical protein
MSTLEGSVYDIFCLSQDMENRLIDALSDVLFLALSRRRKLAAAAAADLA